MNRGAKGSGRVFVPTDRLETLADGIFAIAMTILVVLIEIPVGPVSSYGLLMNTMGNVVPKFPFSLKFPYTGGVLDHPPHVLRGQKG